MEIYNGTGVLKTAELRVQKSLHAIIIASSKSMSDLTTETITAWVEKSNGSNIEICTNILLADFIIGSTYGDESIQSDAANGFIAICELSDGDGAYTLSEGESFKFVLNSLLAPSTYKLYGLEDPDASLHLIKFERKTIAAEDYNKSIITQGFDLVMINDPSSVVADYTLVYDNGQRVKYLPFELMALSRDIDPIAAIKADGTVVQTLGRLTIPLGGKVDAIEVNKANTATVVMVLRSINFAV